MSRIFIRLSFAILLSACFGTTVRAVTIVDAASCSSSDVQTAINNAASGDVVVVPSGSCTWSSQVTISGKALTLAGQTVCTGSPPTSCTDNTNIALNLSTEALSIPSTSATDFVRVTGFTFTIGANDDSHGQIYFDGTFQTVGFRYDHNHQIVNTGNVGTIAMVILDVFGVIDHNVFDIQDTDTSDHDVDVYGDWASGGFVSWQQPSSLGTNQAVYMESNTFNNANQNEECTDGYAGARTVFRNNQVNNIFIGEHGTDTGSYRSTFSLEVYNNIFTNNSSTNFGMFQSRGGVVMIWGNTQNGSAVWGPVTLQYFRLASFDHGGIANWGYVDGTQWLLESTTDTNQTQGRTNSTDGPNWTANTAYVDLAPIIPTSNNSGGYNYTAQGACVSGGSAPSFNQTMGGDTTDGTCTWYNEGGGPAGSAGAWCAINRDFPATSNAVCAALTAGDTATTFFDGSGAAGYPARDQPGMTHNQVLAADYEWINTPDEGFQNQSGSLLAANRDYYQYTTSFTGATGVGSGLLSARPATCVPQVAYWATDQNTLYKCATAGWTAYYTPFTFPDPLTIPAAASSLNATAF